MSERIDRILTSILALATVTIAVTYARRTYVASDRASTGPVATQAPQYIKNWQELVRSGHVVGDANAPFKLVEFADFECPFCRASDTVYRALKRQLGKDLVLTYVHYPLGIHRFAVPAARAAECAADQGQFSRMHDILFDKQDSLGLKSWASFANEVGIDTLRFLQCLHDVRQPQRIGAGRGAGASLGVRGTPTILLNGWRFSSPPSLDELAKAVQNLKLGRGLDEGSDGRPQ